MTNAEIIAKFPGYSTMDPNAIQADFAQTGGSGKGGAPSSLGGSTSLGAPATPQTDFPTYLDNYQGSLLNMVADLGTPAVKSTYTPDELAKVLVEKGGYNSTDAMNAAQNKGGRADELAREFGLIGGNADTKGKITFDSIKSQITSSAYPEPINRMETFNNLREQKGVSGLEETLNTLKADQREIDAQLRANKTAERGKVVAQNVIEGRISKETQQAQENYDFVSRQIASITDQLNTAYNVINMTMEFQNLDYQDAVQKYNTEFNQNMAVIDLVRGLKKDAITEQQRQIDNARANLQIYTNAITSGNLNPSSMSSDQKLQLAKLEAQAGLPVGFTSSLGLSAKDKIISTSTNNGVTSVVMADSSGNLTIKKVGTPTSTGSSIQSTQTKALEKELSTGITIDQAIKKFPTLSPDVIYDKYQALSPNGKLKESNQELKDKYNITVPTTKADETVTVGQDLRDAKAAIQAGANEDDVRRRFIETHPSSAKLFEDYIY